MHVLCVRACRHWSLGNSPRIALATLFILFFSHTFHGPAVVLTFFRVPFTTLGSPLVVKASVCTTVCVSSPRVVAYGTQRNCIAYKEISHFCFYQYSVHVIPRDLCTILLYNSESTLVRDDW